jgi:hypothetical protein
MTDFVGNIESFLRINATNEAHAFEAAPPPPLARSSADAWGVRAVGSPAAQPRIGRAGLVEEQFGGRLFERIIISPRVVNLGMVLTAQTVTVSLWNSCRNLEQFMSTIGTAGPGSAVLPAFAFPVAFPPLAETLAVLTFPTEGDPTVEEDVTFVFPGFEGTDIEVTGQRLAFFSVAADWTGGIAETPQIWLTDVLKGLTDAEQRIQLRTIPRSRIKFKVLSTGRETAFLDGLLSAWQQNLFGVPFWPDKVPLLAPASAGDAALSFAWADREFAPGGYLALWRDFLTYEVMTIAALVSGGVTLTGTLQNDWLADGRSWAVPIRRGRLADKVDFIRKNQETAEVEFAFECEVV